MKGFLYQESSISMILSSLNADMTSGQQQIQDAADSWTFLAYGGGNEGFKNAVPAVYQVVLSHA